MPTTPTTLLTPRDLDILAALDYGPLTAEQLLKLSRTFARPFTDVRRVRERMQALAESGRVRRHVYATASPGAPHYFTLSPLGFQLLYGHDAPLPRRRAFAPVGLARQRHTFALAEFVVHALVAAHAAGVRVLHFERENEMRLEVGGESLYPDCSFQLLAADGRGFNFLVEIDNRTERLRSTRDADSWDRKLRLYEAYADQALQRFRVLVVTAQGSDRLRHLLALASARAGNPHRRLVYGVRLGDFFATPVAVTTPCLLDHRLEPAALVPTVEQFSLALRTEAVTV